MTRSVLVHVHVSVPDDDERTADEIALEILRSLADDFTLDIGDVVCPLAEVVE